MADRSFSCAWVHRIQNCQNSKSQGTRYQGNLPNESSCWRIAVHAPNVECTVALIMSWHVRLCTRLSLLFRTASGGKLGRGLGTRLPLVKKKSTELCVCVHELGSPSEVIYTSFIHLFLAQGVAPTHQVRVRVFVQLAGGVAAVYRVAQEQELEVDTRGTRPTAETHWLTMTMIFRYICLSSAFF